MFDQALMTAKSELLFLLLFPDLTIGLKAGVNLNCYILPAQKHSFDLRLVFRYWICFSCSNRVRRAAVFWIVSPLLGPHT